jgi:hypothetical protein
MLTIVLIYIVESGVMLIAKKELGNSPVTGTLHVSI